MVKPKKTPSPENKEKLERCKTDLAYFIEYIHPKRMLGNIHREVISWWESGDAKSHQLLLLPRDHGKSAMIGYRCAQAVLKNPSIRILYISSTANLATKQLKFIKDILTSDRFRAICPEMVIKEEAKREKWTEREISVDHPQRKEDAIRDPTIFTAGLTSNIVGLHCDIAVLDDVVVTGNAYIAEMREKVKDQYSLLSSIEGTESKEWIVGTRYHPHDLYENLMSMKIEKYDDDGNVVKEESLFDVMEYSVESAGDGSGEFLWPKTKNVDGKYYGFDRAILNDKKAKYLNRTHFRAQYYNDPRDIDSSPIKRDRFQYYEQQFVSRINGHWSFKGNRLNVFAAVDFAYTTGKKSDYTSVVVIGVDSNNNYYVLDIDRFKTDSIGEYYTHILKLHEKWGFRKIRAEVSAAQSMLVKDLKENYIRKNGLALSIDEFRPTRWLGAKEERINAVLEPKYYNQQIWHYRGGNCQALEEELMFANPEHDDIKDALASVIDLSIAPTFSFGTRKEMNPVYEYHPRFGGVA